MQLKKSHVLLLCTGVALLFLPVAAEAQWMDCSQCDPWSALCEDPCSYCANGGIDYCEKWAQVTTTCGEYWGACIPEGCGPNWYIASYENVGTYGESTYGWGCTWNCYPWGCTRECGPWRGCEHHRVDRVVWRDANQCNVNPFFHDKPGCEDWVDATKPFEQTWGSGPDCCDPIVCADPPDPRCWYDDRFTCNHWHSC